MAEVEKIFYIKDQSSPICEELPKIIYYLQTMGIPVFVQFDRLRKNKIKAFTVNRKESRVTIPGSKDWGKIDNKFLKQWIDESEGR